VRGVLVKKSSKIFVVTCVLLFVASVGLLAIHWFVYPFTSAQPNYADVEAVYDKMVVPDSWVKKGEGANKGIAGRRCPIESDGCFSKVGRFGVPKGTTEEEVKRAYESLGCISVIAQRTEQKGGVTYTDFECSSGALRVSGSMTERNEWELTINVGTR
jgi:hypothetical protein